MRGGFSRGRGNQGRGGRGRSNYCGRSGGQNPTMRNTDPKTFMYALKTEDYKVVTPAKAKLLLRTMKSYDDLSRLLLDLTDQRNFGFHLIRNIIEQCDLSSSDDRFSIDLLSFFMQDYFDKPMLRRPRDSIMLHICQIPFFLHQLSEYALGEATQEEGSTLCKYVLLSIQSSLEILKNEDIRALTTALHNRGFPEARKIFQIICQDEDSALSTMERLNSVLGQAKVGAKVAKVATTVERRPPGGRHENDKVQFREISIIPTIEEVLCEEMAYLPLSNGTNRFIEDKEEWYLDSMFRLLRFDTLDPIREAFTQDNQNSSRKFKRYSGCYVMGVHVVPKAKEVPSIILSFDSPFKGPHPDQNSEKKKDFWLKKSMLTYSAVICLRRNQQPFSFATITSVSLDWLQDEFNNPPQIGVTCGSEAELLKLLHEYNPESHDFENIECDMLVVSSGFFASINVLKGLQKMHSIPLSEYIVPNVLSVTRGPPAATRLDINPHTAMRDEAPAYMSPTISIPGVTGIDFDLTSDLFVEECIQHSTLDESQGKALLHALTHRVSLIQGPPGTGKTYVGSLLARIILKCSPGIKILCLCYTNHALDQFLEYLIEDGVTDIVRLGSRSKSKIVEQYNLNNLAYNNRYARTKEENRCYYQNMNQCDALQQKIQALQQEIQYFEDPLNVKWFDLQNIIDLEVLQQFSMPCDEDGFQYGNKKANEPDYLWNIWSMNKTLPMYLRERLGLATGFIWSLTSSQRGDMVKGWLHEHVQGLKVQLVTLFKSYNKQYEALQAAKNGAKRAVLSQARVIGATTSGATNCKELLESCDIEVVLVEEAGEVLEAHVVTSLTATVKHLILIGDHKQLRPKVQSYDLQVVSGKGYDLDQSMFERLVLSSGLKPSVLATQRRMQPQISQMIRFTYPNLVDHESVEHYPDIKGLLKNVTFLDHREPETSINGAAFSNTYEIETCVQIARLLLLNGYKTEQLVILTPYLGQLMKIQKHISSAISDVQALISEIDRADMLKEGLLAEENDEDFDGDYDDRRSGMKKSVDTIDKKYLRTATVDNFQGEEADVVIISLVRSNNHGQVGFLKEPERVNVLLSRAKHGMIILGNEKTSRMSKKASHVWEPILNYLKSESCIVSGLPAFCQLHPTDIVELKTPDDFISLRPNGGCNKKCEFRMNCGHVCTQFCHAIDQEHEHQKCFKPCLRVPEECNSGHRCPKLCYEECGKCKVPAPDIELSCGHTRTVTCHDVSNEERKNKLRCVVQNIPVVMPECGHAAKISCTASQRPSSEWVCLAACEELLECGHPCRDTCHTCRKRSHHSSECRQKCERTLFCGHVCGQNCHQQCSKCTQPCYQSCVHSKCPRKCFEVCASCIEPCAWECEHQGRCQLLCGAPCTRLPCDLRCPKMLPCGHQCPTVCGEPCPSKQYCQECGDRRSDVADIIEMGPYSDCNLDEDPICVLPCGHFYTISTLDGHMQLSEFYHRDGGDSSSEKGAWAAPRILSEAEQSSQPKSCPSCKGVISAVYRYGRAIQNSELRLLEKKFRFHNDDLLLKASQIPSGEKKLKYLEELLKSMTTKSPTRRLFDAMGGSEQVEIAEPPSQPLLQAAVLYGNALNDSDVSTLWIKRYGSRAVKMLSSFLVVADAKNYLSKSADIRLATVRFQLKRFPALAVRQERGLQEEMIRMLEQISSTDPTHALLEAQRADAVQLKQVITEQISKDEVNEILQAMGENNGRNFYGGSWSSHWFECPNGHPYFIGECGGAMEESQCPECGATVGGTSHRLTATNRTASDLFRFSQR